MPQHEQFGVLCRIAVEQDRQDGQQLRVVLYSRDSNTWTYSQLTDRIVLPATINFERHSLSPDSPEFNLFVCETTPRAAERLSSCRTEIAQSDIRKESVEMFRRTGLLVAALAVAAGITPVAAASTASVSTAASAASAPYCGITWGSQAKTVGAMTADTQLTNIRAGRHGCYDRLVFDVRLGNVKWHSVKYVTALTDNSGRVVPLRGGAKLSITALIADHDPMTGQPYPYPNRAELVNVSGYPTFRQVAWADSDRHLTHFGLGVRARLPFRVFTLPGRLVIDVAHRW